MQEEITQEFIDKLYTEGVRWGELTPAQRNFIFPGFLEEDDEE